MDPAAQRRQRQATSPLRIALILVYAQFILLPTYIWDASVVFPACESFTQIHVPKNLNTNIHAFTNTHTKISPIHTRGSPKAHPGRRSLVCAGFFYCKRKSRCCLKTSTSRSPTNNNHVWKLKPRTIFQESQWLSELRRHPILVLGRFTVWRELLGAAVRSFRWGQRRLPRAHAPDHAAYRPLPIPLLDVGDKLPRWLPRYDTLHVSSWYESALTYI